MTKCSDILKLPICPVCKDTRPVAEDPILVVTAKYVCRDCNVRWGDTYVERRDTRENLFPTLFPGELQRGRWH